MSDSPSVDGSSAQRPITVLLIDDQPIVAESVRRMLAGEPDIVFHYCQNPARAIETANQVQPTVILQDLVMPEIDGLLLVKFLRANKATRDVPMIVLSGKEEPAIKAQAFALGANDYLVKFPDKLEVVARLRYHSRGYIALLERNEAYERGRLVPAGGQCGQRDLGSLAGRYRFPRSRSRRYGEMPTPVGSLTSSARWFIKKINSRSDCPLTTREQLSRSFSVFVYRLIRVPFLIASILILTAGGAGFLYRQQSPPSIPTFPIRISPAALHLGTLLESAAYRHELPLVNVSQRTLTVQVDRSCSCTRLEPDRLVLRPGETQRVSLELDLLHGRDQAGNVPLRSFGTQLGLTCQETGQRASVTLSARVQTILTCDPPRLHLTAGVVDEEDSPEQVVAIRPVVPLRWLVVKEASKHLAAKLEPPEKAGDAYRLRVRVRQGTPRGSLDEAVTLELEDATGKPLPEQLVRVTGCVTGYFDCIPRESTLGIRPVGEEVTETVQIQAVTGLQASRVEPVADKGIAVIPGPEPLTFTVRLRVDRPGELGACTSFVVTDVAGRQHHVNHLLSCYGIEGRGRASP